MEAHESKGSFSCRRGYDLATVTLQPPGSEPPKALLVWHHGFSEHYGRHLAVLRELCVQGHLLVVSYDVHGHGRSGPHQEELRAYIADYQHLVDDLLDLLDKVALPAAKEQGVAPGAVFLGGHSMGGMTSLLALAQRPGAFAGVLASSPLVSVTPRQSWGEWAQIGVLRVLDALVPQRPFLQRKRVEEGVRCPQGVKDCYADTLWYRGPIKLRTVVSCINGTLALQQLAPRLTGPLYFQQGTMDRTCSVVALRRLLPRLGSADVTYHEVEGGFHDLSHDPDTPDCIRRMLRFIAEHSNGSKAAA
ncbi:Alpha/Beta hydrolase protein [Haematococcus lacustris]